MATIVFSLYIHRLRKFNEWSFLAFQKFYFYFTFQNFSKNSPPLLPMTSGPNYLRNSFNYGIVRTVILETFLSLPQKFSRRWFYSLHHNSKANSDEIEPMWGKNSQKLITILQKCLRWYRTWYIGSKYEHMNLFSAKIV